MQMKFYNSFSVFQQILFHETWKYSYIKYNVIVICYIFI